MKKRFFVLLEILIALTIISLCIIPLIRNPVYFYKNEIKSLKELELIRTENETLIEIKKKLFKNEISWDSFAMQSRYKAPIQEVDFFQTIKNPNKQKPPIYYRMWTKKLNIQKNKILRKVAIQISSNKKDFQHKSPNKPFVHFVFVQKNLVKNLNK